MKSVAITLLTIVTVAPTAWGQYSDPAAEYRQMQNTEALRGIQRELHDANMNELLRRPDNTSRDLESQRRDSALAQAYSQQQVMAMGIAQLQQEVMRVYAMAQSQATLIQNQTAENKRLNAELSKRATENRRLAAEIERLKALGNPQTQPAPMIDGKPEAAVHKKFLDTLTQRVEAGDTKWIEGMLNRVSATLLDEPLRYTVTVSKDGQDTEPKK